MNTAHHGAPSWRADVSEVARRASSAIERACLGLANAMARGLRKLGFSDLADLLASP
jgi:hypothetical protein